METIYQDANWKLDKTNFAYTATNLKNGRYYHCCVHRVKQWKPKAHYKLALYWDYNHFGNSNLHITPSYLDDVIKKDVNNVSK